MPTVVHSDSEIIDADLLARELGDVAEIEVHDTETEPAVADAIAADVLVLDDRAPITAEVMSETDDFALIARGAPASTRSISRRRQRTASPSRTSRPTAPRPSPHTPSAC